MFPCFSSMSISRILLSCPETPRPKITIFTGFPKVIGHRSEHDSAGMLSRGGWWPSSRRLENTAWLAHWYWPGWIPWWHFPMFSKTWNAFWKFHPLCNSHKPEMLACFQRAPSNIDGTVRFSRPNMAGAISSRLKCERWGIPVGSPKVSTLITQ